MSLLRRLRPGIASLFLVAGAGWVFGEVAVDLDGEGKYRHVVLLQGMLGKRPIVWAAVRPGADSRLVLNPRGDEVGDLPPSVREHPGTGLPWAVWSLNDGTDYEIAFSFFNGQQWAVVRLVEVNDNPFHDLDPVLEFTRDGTGVLAWWRAAPVSQVLVSFLRGGRWSAPLAISPADTASRHPRLRIRPGRVETIEVSFETPGGTETEDLTQSYSASSSPSTTCDPAATDCDISDGPDVDGVGGPPRLR